MSTQIESAASTDGTNLFVRAGKGARIGAYLIDVVPAIFFGLIGIVPVIGPVLAGLILTPYWLLRDIMGASLGKRLLGLKVMSQSGAEATKGALAVRNLPLVVGPGLMIIPMLGYVLGPGAALVIIVIEAVCLLATGERMGDKLAGTVVVMK
jgi:uncharacterized RDD family membrane protein YckC